MISVRLVRRPAVLLEDGTIGGDARVAPTITESALPSERVALLRARAEIDAHVPMVPCSITMPDPGNLMPGTIGQLIDSERQPVAAKLVAITHTISIGDDGSLTADATLGLERIDD